MKENSTSIIDAGEILSAERQEAVNCQEKEDSGDYIEHSYEDARVLQKDFVNQGTATTNKLLQLLLTSQNEVIKLQKLMKESIEVVMVRRKDTSMNGGLISYK